MSGMVVEIAKYAFTMLLMCHGEEPEIRLYNSISKNQTIVIDLDNTFNKVPLKSMYVLFVPLTVLVHTK